MALVTCNDHRTPEGILEGVPWGLQTGSIIIKQQCQDPIEYTFRIHWLREVAFDYNTSRLIVLCILLMELRGEFLWFRHLSLAVQLDDPPDHRHLRF
ncbi:hypothetical protein ACFSCZ_11485 [Siminovitchia sediminis]|uniref:Uncharacterized protein n=1 Tax=Siminovitchia sediminis TaxID=1274353 RepID=A0ABW4KMB7_9BACI